MKRRNWNIGIIIGFLILLVSACGPAYRRYSYRRLPRRVVRRERNMLRRRLARWRNRISRIFDREDDVVFAKRRTRVLKRRVKRGRWVLRMLNRKLRRQGRRISFNRRQWRRARHVGCRVYR